MSTWTRLLLLACAIIGLGNLIGLAFGAIGDSGLALGMASASVGIACLGAAIPTMVTRGTSRQGASGPDKTGTGRPGTSGLGRQHTTDTGKNCHTGNTFLAATDHDTRSLVGQMLCQGRYALLLRPQIACNLPEDQRAGAADALHEAMAPVPRGGVLMQHMEDERNDDAASPGGVCVVDVEAFCLDRYPVTNRQYREFVTAGGYEQMTLWDTDIRAAVPDFVDRTARPGPRYWSEGTYPPGEDDYPVVGVSWYEAAAYCRWVGKRLPTDPEWVKAASWPVPVAGSLPRQRKYPWGNTMDHHLANLFGSGLGRPVPVTELAGGAGAGGIFQLVGNVWEWTVSDFGTWHPMGHRIDLSAPTKSLRGGAFDTYFDNQATCHFQSGDAPTARKPNIGFRCALGACDVSLAPAQEEPSQASAGEELAVAAGVGEDDG